MTVEVPTHNDELDEDDATLTLELLEPAMDAGYTLGTAVNRNIIVADDDNPPVASIGADVSVNEGGTLTFTASLDAASGKTVTVPFRLGGTATPAVDYTLPSPLTVEIARGTTSTTFDIVTLQDSLDENDETVEVTLEAPTGSPPSATLGTRTIATGTIIDDDIPNLSVNSLGTVMEGDDSETTELEFEVTPSAAPDANATVRYEITSTGERGTDFTVSTLEGTLNFAAGRTDAQPIPVITVLGDGTFEEDETVTVTLSMASPSTAVGLGTSVGTATIGNDDEPPVITIAPASPTLEEGDTGDTTEFRYVMTKTGETEVNASVAYAITGTATVIDDYTHTPGSPIEFTAAETTKEIVVDVAEDNLAEVDETVIVTLSSPMGASFASGASTISATGTITDDDRGMSITSPTASESDSGAATMLDFVVNLDGEWPQEVAVDYEVTGGSATVVSDYMAPTDSTLTFAAGTAGPVTVSVPVVNDSVSEGDETVEVTLSNARCTTSCGASLAPSVPAAAATGTIRDDDAPTFTVSVDDATEGDSGTSPMTFTVTMSTAWDRQVTVNYAVTGGTGAGEATVGQDFRTASGTLTFAPAAGGNPAEMEKTVEVAIIGDTTVEPDETVILSLSNATGGARVSQSDWTGTILSDDYEVTVAAVPASVAEPAAGGQPADVDFTVTLAGTWTRDVAVDYALDGGTATLDVDYSDATTQTDSGSEMAGRLLFAQGVTVRTVSVTVNPDIVDDGDETVGVRILSLIGTVLASAQVTITQAAPTVVSVQHGQTQEVDGTTTSVFQVSVQGAAGRSFGIAFDWRVTRIRETGSDDSRTYTVDVLASSSSPVRLAAGEDTAEIEATFSQSVESTDQLGFEISSLDCGTGSCAVSQARSAQTLSAALSGSLTPATAAVAVAFQPQRFSDQETSLQQHALAGFGRNIATGIVGGIWKRADAHRSGGFASTVQIGGRDIDTAAMSSGDAGSAVREAARLFGVHAVQPSHALAGSGDGFAEGTSGDLAAWRSRTIIRDGENLLERSHFSLVVGDEADGRSLGVWGSGSMSSFKSEPEDGASVEGSAQVMLAGVDWRSGEILAGVALSRLSGDSDYKASSGGQANMGAVETSLTGVTPYMHWLGGTGLGVWGSFGVGSGTAEMGSGSAAVEADVSMTMLALGAKGASRRRGRFDYAIRGDIFRTSMTAEQTDGFDELAAEASRLRLALEGDSTRQTASGGTVSNRFELGVRMDSGDGAEGAGADVAGEIRYASADGGLEMAGRVSLLLLHSQEGFSEWGAGLDVAYAPGQGGRGLRLSLEPRWNVLWAGSADSLWSGAAPGADMDAGSAKEAGASLRARLGYGVGAFGELALASPYSEIGADDGERRVQLGVELRGASASLERLSVDLYGKRDENGQAVERRAMLEARLGF